MSSKTELTFDILGNDKSGSAAFKKVGKSAASAKTDIDKYGGKLNAVGEASDKLDTRTMGLRDGIDGLSTIMAGPGTAGTSAYLQGFADLGSSGYNFVIPMLKDVGEKFKASAKDALNWAKANKGALVGVAAGAGALVAAISLISSAQEEQRQQMVAWGKSLDDAGFSESKLAKDTKRLAEAMGESGIGGDATHSMMAFQKAGESLVAFAEDAGITGDELAALQEQEEKADQAAAMFGASSSQAQGELNKLNMMVREATGGMVDLADGLQNTAEWAGELDTATAKLKEQLFGVANDAIAADEAQQRWTEALADGKTSATDLAQAAQNLITTQADLGVSGDELVAVTQSVRDQFVAAMTASLGSAEAAEDLANRYGLIPGDVATAVRMTGYENLLAKMEAIANWAATGFVIPVNIQAQGQSILAGAFRTAAHGGLITGPGSSTSDSIPTLLSDGEFVMNAAATKKNRPLLEAINSGGTGGSSGGGAQAHPIVIENHIEIGGEVVRVVRQEIGQSNRQTRRKVGAGAGAAR